MIPTYTITAARLEDLSRLSAIELAVARLYARLGFDVVAREQLPAGLRAVIDDETRRGFDPSRRVAMKRPTRWNGANDE